MYALARPILFSMDPETAHRLVFRTLRTLGPVARAMASLAWGPPPPQLATEVAGLRLAGPVGLAAGLDKDGVLARFWPTCGFGFVELGTVTAHPQPGNPQPRLFRFPDQGALVNRMGFNNHGSEGLAERLRGVGRLAVPCGVNLGKSKITPLDEAVDDYATSTERVADVADYLVINVSSPNTPGLRKLQDRSFLLDIANAVMERAKQPVFIKLAPDLTEDAITDAARVAEEAGAAGIIATNTTIERPGIPDVGPGGLSGAPLAARSLEVVRLVCERTELPVIGVGGISSAEGAAAMLAAGASAVQVYSALIFHGPGLVHRINRGLVAMMEQRGAQTVAELRASLREG